MSEIRTSLDFRQFLDKLFVGLRQTDHLYHKQLFCFVYTMLQLILILAFAMGKIASGFCHSTVQYMSKYQTSLVFRHPKTYQFSKLMLFRHVSEILSIFRLVSETLTLFRYVSEILIELVILIKTLLTITMSLPTFEDFWRQNTFCCKNKYFTLVAMKNGL